MGFRHEWLHLHTKTTRTLIHDIVNKSLLQQEDLAEMLRSAGKEEQQLFNYATRIKEQYVGNKVYYRGLIELANICSKNCYYCGIRGGNKAVSRYMVADEEVLDAARYALEHKFGSVVIQGGERSGKNYVKTITRLLRSIKEISSGTLGITLSLGEQTEETYREWFEAGAHRYLLRIETSNPDLYRKLHPANRHHDYDKRLDALRLLNKVGYNVGTGVMIGLPFQTLEDLAGDLIFFRDWDIDMIGMGPYIEHEQTPLYRYRHLLMSRMERFRLALRMVAALRILMKDVNIAATTAMQTLHPQGRELALKAGANIIMPNLTPLRYREGYLLYQNKPGLDEQAEVTLEKLRKQIEAAGCVIALGEWGDSRHFSARQQKLSINENPS